MKKYFLITLIFTSLTGFSQKTKLKPEIGIAESIDNELIIKNAGFCCLVESIGKLISPKAVSEANFQQNLLKLNALKTPIYAYNIFLPGDLKLVGPNVDEKAILEYTENTLRRMSQTGTKLIIWGSGGARKLPEGFDREIATKQFIYIAKKIAQVAQKYDITLSLELLNKTECNFINSVKECLYIVKKVNHPNLRLNVDIYHMLKEGEGPKIIAKTKKYLNHVEIAERDGRTAPGVQGTDFKPYLKELAKINYHQKIVIEGRWNNLSEIAKMSHDYLQKQINEAYD